MCTPSGRSGARSRQVGDVQMYASSGVSHCGHGTPPSPRRGGSGSVGSSNGTTLTGDSNGKMSPSFSALGAGSRPSTSAARIPASTVAG